MVELPSKPAGQKYFILLRTNDYSGVHTAAAGGLGLSSQLPPLAFTGTRCICCSRDAAGQTIDVPMTNPSGRFSADPVPAPCCAACHDHALANTGGEITGALMLVIGLAAAIWGATAIGRDRALGGGAIALGLVLIGIAALVLAGIKRKRLETTRDGHFPGLAVLVSPRQCAIHTRNRDLAVALVDSHRDFVAKAR